MNPNIFDPKNYVPSAKGIAIDDKLLVLNQLSGSFGLAISDEDYLRKYGELLFSNNNLIDNCGVLAGKFDLGTKQVDNLSQEILAPLSATIANTGALAASVNQGFRLGETTKSIFDSTQSILDLNTEILKEQQNYITAELHSIKKDDQLDSFLAGVEPSTHMISSGLSQIANSAMVFTAPTLISMPSLSQINKELYSESAIEEHQEKLDNILTSIDPSLVEFRRGCWETFRKRGKDYIGQAASSMRRLVECLIEKLAPEENVKKTEYYLKNEDKRAKTDKDLPTRRAKLFYIMNYDEEGSEHLKRVASLADSLLVQYDNLPALDHRPGGRYDFVNGIFIATEGLLLSLLDKWKEI